MRDTVDQDEFMQLVKANPGISSPKCADHLLDKIPKVNLHRRRMRRAVGVGVRDGWLCVIKYGAINRLYTVEYAVKHGLYIKKVKKTKRVKKTQTTTTKNNIFQIDRLMHPIITDSN